MLSLAPLFYWPKAAWRRAKRPAAYRVTQRHPKAADLPRSQDDIAAQIPDTLRFVVAIQNALRQNGLIDAISPQGLKLQKLLYLAYGRYMIATGRRLGNEAPVVWTHGPMFPQLYELMKYYPRQILPTAATPAYLHEAEQAVLNSVLADYGSFSGEALASICHAEGSAWHLYSISHDYKSDQRPMADALITWCFSQDPKAGCRVQVTTVRPVSKDPVISL